MDEQLAWAQQHAISLARDVIIDVPAYQSFLRSCGSQISTVESWDDFQRLPLTSKKDYLQASVLPDLCWPQDATSGPRLVCSTSGSTGTPFYFPRDELLAEQNADIHAAFLARASRGPTPTLAIVAFGMGVWIGGMITVKGLEIAATRLGYPLSILPAGVSPNEILNALRELAPRFDQTILFGYPPFVREILVDAREAGIDLAGLNLRLSFAAEAFSDEFRAFVCDIAGIRDPHRDTLNVYGSADIGGMAAETPLSIAIREAASTSPALWEELFGDLRNTPTLAQFDPQHILFEELDGELVLTGNSALPLVRYRIGDRGGVRSYRDVQAAFTAAGMSLEEQAELVGAPIETRNPFVFVYERVDLSVSLYGMNIFPEFVKGALHELTVSARLSGRFSMNIEYSDEQEQLLHIHVEALGDQVPSRHEVESALVEGLTVRSSEFRELAHQLDRRLLRVTVWGRGESPHFSGNGKQAWVVRQREAASELAS